MMIFLNLCVYAFWISYFFLAFLGFFNHHAWINNYLYGFFFTWTGFWFRQIMENYRKRQSVQRQFIEKLPTKHFMGFLNQVGIPVKWWYPVIDRFWFGRIYLEKKFKEARLR
jgi:hypothetical protein